MKYFILLLMLSLSLFDAHPAWDGNVPMRVHSEQVVQKEEPEFSEKVECNTKLGMESGNAEKLPPEPVTEKYYPHSKMNTKDDSKGSHDSTAHAEYSHIAYDFEGDIVATVDEIEKLYYMSEHDKRQLEASAVKKYGVNYQAVNNEEGTKWQDQTVPYEIDNDYGQAEKRIIEQAIQGWQSVTCLRFIERITENDYIYFNKATEFSLCNSPVGRRGGRQTINLPEWCVVTGTILHEIGHALGLWHEQSRPDRDSYITLLDQNIYTSALYQFYKRRDKYIDFQGTEYDYGSLMHYNLDAHVRVDCIGCQSMQINNWAAFNAQGRPYIGEKQQISPRDATQINRLYNCPNDGHTGSLWVKIRRGHNLRDLVFSGLTDPFIKISGVDSNGVEYHRQTSIKYSNRNPTWSEWVVFPGRRGWQLLRLRVWDHHTNSPMTMSETIPLLEHPTQCSNCLHCANVACNVTVTYDYEVLRDRSFYMYVQEGENLPDMDPEDYYNPRSDPYVSVFVYNPASQAIVWNTTYKSNTRSPIWHEAHEFGYGPWKNYEIKVFDKDDGITDAQISKLGIITLPSNGDVIEENIYFTVGKGHIKVTLLSWMKQNY